MNYLRNLIAIIFLSVATTYGMKKDTPTEKKVFKNKEEALDYIETIIPGFKKKNK